MLQISVEAEWCSVWVCNACIHVASHTETMNRIKMHLKQSDISDNPFIEEITLDFTLKAFPSTEQLQPDMCAGALVITLFAWNRFHTLSVFLVHLTTH